MSTRAQALAERRERLLERSGRLREHLREDAAALAARFEFLDRLSSLARSPWARMLAAAGAALLLYRRPRRLMRLVVRIAPFVPALSPAIRKLVGAWRAGRRRADAAPEAAPVSPPP